ncbi:hypothetical protein Y1Q_0008974 [Alligator mississippiensis]|uniref:Uncharacterized protein n=1 Tax=Alligator mississippiensis TaxID=8496 RepID=A0A151NKT7_ALLMI|nr:hypothetical protein Y1Q_0008974 [Alligator mississippiensis]
MPNSFLHLEARSSRLCETQLPLLVLKVIKSHFQIASMNETVHQLERMQELWTTGYLMGFKVRKDCTTELGW